MTVSILIGDCREMLATLPDESVQCCVTSPPYFNLRDYGVDGQIGLEPTPDAYIAELVAVFREVRRVLRKDGTLWVNIGDSYAGSWGAQGRQGTSGQMAGRAVTKARAGRSLSEAQIAAHPQKVSRTGSIAPGSGLKAKDRMMIPARVALALQADGWWLRDEIIWHKPNAMPSSVDDRTTSAHEMVYLLSKRARYFYDAKAIAEPATGRAAGNKRPRVAPGQRPDSMHKIGARDERNRRSVWSIPTEPFAGAHFAAMPQTLAALCIKAGSRPGGMVLDPFGGSGTTGLAASFLGRDATLIELNPAYAEIARERVYAAGLFSRAAE